MRQVPGKRFQNSKITYPFGSGLREKAGLPQQFKRWGKATENTGISKRQGMTSTAVSPYVPGMGFHYGDGPQFGTELEEPGVLVDVTNGSYTPDHGKDLVLGATE